MKIPELKDLITLVSHILTLLIVVLIVITFFAPPGKNVLCVAPTPTQQHHSKTRNPNPTRIRSLFENFRAYMTEQEWLANAKS
jgi:hypothetical protein